MELPVEKILKEKRVSYRLIKLEQNAYTVDDVIKFSKEDITAAEICKTIILKGKKSSKMIAILLKGKDKINFTEAKKFFDEEMAVANPEEVKEASGVEPGAVCPLLLNVSLCVDRKVLELNKINCGSGHHLFGLEFSVEDLRRVINYIEIDIARNN